MTIETSPERAAAEAASYVTLEGQVVDLSGLNEEERAFFVRAGQVAAPTAGSSRSGATAAAV